MLIRVCSRGVAIEILVAEEIVYQPRAGLSSKMVWRTEVTPSSVGAKSIVREDVHISFLYCQDQLE